MQNELFPIPITDELTVFCFGGGQDSWAMLAKFIHEPLFRQKYAPNKLLILMSDTGWEHPRTYVATTLAKELCLLHGIEFQLITNDMGFHPNTWQTLTHNWELNSTVGSVVFKQTCTDNIKIKPVDNFVAQHIRDNYNLEGKNRSSIFQKFYYKYGKINWIIGFAKGEEIRIKNQEKACNWKKKAIKSSFPLIDEGIDRQGAQDTILKYGYPLPPPSNCTICFWMSELELIWLYRNLPKHFWYWVKLERNKLNRFRLEGLPENKNNGPFGQISIISKLKNALLKYADYTDAMLDEYKMSHGHCVKSKY